MKNARTILWLLFTAFSCSSIYPITLPPLPQSFPLSTLPTQESMKQHFDSLKKKFDEQVERFKKCTHDKNCSKIAIPAITITVLLLMTLLGRFYITKRRIARERMEALQQLAAIYQPQSENLQQQIAERKSIVENSITGEASAYLSPQLKEKLRKDKEDFQPIYDSAFQDGVSWQDHVERLKEALAIINRNKPQ